MGTKLKKSYYGWKICLLAGSKELSDAVNLRAEKINTIYNGGIRCSLAHIKIYKEKEDNVNEKESQQHYFPNFEELSPGAQMLYYRLKKNAKRLKPWLSEKKIECYRLYNADMPEYAVAVDIYPPEVVIQEYAPPKTIDTVAAARRFREAVSAVQAWQKIPKENIRIKTRQKQKGKNQYNKNSNNILQQNDRRIIKENGLRFLIDTKSYLDTGIFLDSRPIRSLIKKEAENKDFLNLFCYTGTASVYAKAGGAISTTSVDTSETYLDWAKMNMKINGFENNNNSFVKSDCISWLKTATGSWNLIYIDPPTFSNSKDRIDVFDLQRDHEDLIRLSASRLKKDGLLLFCNNFRKFKMSQNIIEDFQVEEITSTTLDPDFKRKTIHRCWRIKSLRN